MPNQTEVLEVVDISIQRRWVVAMSFRKRDDNAGRSETLTVNILWIDLAPTEGDAYEQAEIWAHTESHWSREIAGSTIVWRQAVEITCRKCGG